MSRSPLARRPHRCDHDPTGREPDDAATNFDVPGGGKAFAILDDQIVFASAKVPGGNDCVVTYAIKQITVRCDPLSEPFAPADGG